MNAADTGWPRGLNPLVKLAGAMLWLIALTFATNPIALGLAILLLAGLLILCDGAAPSRLLLVLSPFALFGAGFLWSHWLHPVALEAYADSLGGQAGRTGPLVALTLFLRAIAYGAVSYAFVRTTDPGDLVHAAMRHLRLPQAMGFGLFAMAQIPPALRQDYEAIRLARAQRAGRVPRRIPSPRELAGLVVPLMAGAVSRADRAALAMELRGLSVSRPYCSGRRFTLRQGDAVFLTLASALALLLPFA